MIAVNQTVPCPRCMGTIEINVHELINGGKFTCQTCSSVIAIATERKEIVGESMAKFQELKDLKNKK
ncbi:hypothetical protein [Pedobacter gandavensis]|uniref:hypothetical protein n=1 Tax=Pedobacter gandavensis TaxID=2679963 RepID=UPI0029309D78|nr:hypothetical protein [Pedobacter gandavensis]